MNEDLIIQKLLALEVDVESLKETTLSTKEDTKKILESQDIILKQLQTMTHEQTATRSGMKRHEETIEDHESRITHLESSPQAA